MMNYIWVGLVVIALLAGVFTGTIGDVQQAVFDWANEAVSIVIGLVGTMVFFTGLMRVAEEAGLTKKLGKALAPLMKRLFPEVPSDHPAMSSMVMNIAANILGLGNAATPFGLKAMVDLQKLNKTKNIATNSMVMFLGINTSSVTLIPTTVIALRTAAKSSNPAEMVGPIILATIISTATAIITCKLFEKTNRYKWENVIARAKEDGSYEPNEDYVPWEESQLSSN
ncbi:MAG: nucleoside recognition domain-containing protein [Tissierellia bacterium]|nr:nucleoside recognition domain-containing protein [Tissierellia bacterium]